MNLNAKLQNVDTERVSKMFTDNVRHVFHAIFSLVKQYMLKTTTAWWTVIVV